MEVTDSTRLLAILLKKDNQGKIKRMVGIRKDITDFKQAEEELRINKNRLRVLIDTLPTLFGQKTHKAFICNAINVLSNYMELQKKKLWVKLIITS
ncbi:MAG: hypothetical protein R2757_17640 [Draconibacterium sp.]